MRATLLTLLLLSSSAVPAAARQLTIADFHAAIAVQPNGTVRVEERIVADFKGSWNGIFRDIPYGFSYPLGIRGSIRLTVNAVQGADGTPLEFWEQRERRRVRLKIRVPGASDAQRTVVIRYHVENVIRREGGDDASYGLHDQLYWNVTGNDWPVPIARASAEVRLPPGVPSETVIATAYSGYHGARGRGFEIELLDGPGLRFETTRPLRPGMGLTIVAGFEPGHVAHPSRLTRAWWIARENWFLALPPALLAWWFTIWWRRGRDALAGRTIIPEWEPPDGLRPSEVGVVIDDRLDRRDLTAGIIDLAVRRVLTIVDEEHRGYVLRLDPAARAQAKLEPFEERLVDALFAGGSEVALEALDRKFYAEVGRINSAVQADLVAKGIFKRSPRRQRAAGVGASVVAAIAVVVLGIALGAPPPYWVAVALCVPPLFLLAWQMPQRTPRGLDALARIRGMEEYLVTAERERMRTLPLDQFERLLPYAIALDLHRRWTEIFGPLYERPPAWLETPGGFWNAGSMGGTIDGIGSSVGSYLYSVPRTRSSGGSGGGWSGGSGFSGGGSSGGGFGGGGGGGW